MSRTPTPSELTEIRRVKAMIAGATFNTDCFIGPPGPPGPAGPAGPAGATNLPSTPNAVVFMDETGTRSFGVSSFTFVSTSGLFIDNNITITQGVYPKYIQFSTHTINPYTSSGILWFNNTSTLFLDSNPMITAPGLVSTVQGLGTTGYISTLSLTSSLQGLGSLGYISSGLTTVSLTSTVQGLGTTGYISTLSLTSSLQGLGSLGFLSTSAAATGFASTVAGLGTTGYISTLSLTSTVQGLGSTGYLSSLTGTTSAPRLGNVLTVDIVYGNDSTASPGGLPYATVLAAVAAASSGQTIWILPGTHTIIPVAGSGILIPTGVAIRGMNTQTTILQMIPIASGTYTMVTMGTQTRLEDVTLNLTTSVVGANLVGINFPSDTPGTAKLRTMVLNVTSTAGDGTYCYGVFATGTTTNPKVFQSSSAARAITLNVTANVTGLVRGIYVTSDLQYSVRDIIVKATCTGSPADCIGVEGTDSRAYIILKTSSVDGTTNDIKQPAGLATTNSVIQLNATDLINASSAANGFTVNTEPSHLYYVGVGNWVGGPALYLFPGTVAYSALSGTPIGLPFPQKCIIFEAIISCQPALTNIPNTDSVTLTLYKSLTPNTVGTAFATFTANVVNGSYVRFNNFSSTFNPVVDFLQVALTTTNLNAANTTIIVALGVY